MKKYILTFCFLFIVSTIAQELDNRQLDSLYYTFLRMNGISYDIQTQHPVTKPDVAKCGFGIVNLIKLNSERYSVERQQLLKSLLQRPVRQTSILSPSGLFRIHYDTTGNEVPNYDNSLTTAENVREVGIALDSSYNFEVNFLEYPPPPEDNGEGGDNLYDIYITSAAGNYGFTEWEIPLGDQKYTSHIQIHYEFKSGFYTKGLNAMRVTIAHELHHAIQMGNYLLRESDIFFYEISSTAMEEFVYDDVNDYYAYMHDYFRNTDRAFADNDGYNLAVWNIYLRDKFGYRILRKQWEMMPSLRALWAIRNSLEDPAINSSLSQALNEFGIWTFFTGYRTKPGVYFEEASSYPLVDYTSQVDFYPGSTPIQINSKPTANNFVAFVNSSVVPADTLITIITNSDHMSGIDSLNKYFPFNYTLGSDSLDGCIRLNDFYFAKFDGNPSYYWSVSEILNNQVLRENGTIIPPLEKSGDLFAYPNPYFYNKNHNFVYILIEDNDETAYDFNVYSVGMNLVYSTVIQVKNDPFGRKALIWDIRSLNENLPAGVYIYAIRAGDKTSKGKLVIFNE